MTGMEVIMMKRRTRFSVCFLATGMVFAGMSGLQAAASETDPAEAAAATETVADIETEADTQTQEQADKPEDDMVGELIFAQCEEYINVRSDSSKKSDIVAKIYNKDSAVITDQDGSWYQIQSGNVTGYVKAKFFATGAQADAIAEEVAYNVAVVYPEELNVRMQPGEDAEVVTVAHSGDELEVVASEGDWMKVALENDVYGYIHSDYAEYKTYYPTAETPEEEQARLAAETEAAEDEWAQAPAETEPVYETEAPAQTEPTYETEAPVQTEPTYETEAPVQTEPATEPVYTETEPVYEETEPVYEEETAPQETEYEDNGFIYDSDLGENVYVDGTTDTMTYEESTPETEPVYTETEPVYEETEPTYETEATDSSTGQQIVDYAMQFIGNPYVWGGTSLTEGADCSGFTQSVFANSGISLARTAADQSYGGTAVDISSIQPGDLLFYDSGAGIDHVAIYAGGGMIVHASNPRTGITTSNYDYSTPVAARRYY